MTNETREAELARLIAEQAADDTYVQAAERARTDNSTGSVPFLSLDRLSADGTGEETALGGFTMSAEEEYLAGLEDEGEDFETVVLAKLSTDERELYLDVFGEGLSLREVEEKTGRSKSSIQRDVAALRAKLAELLKESLDA